MPKNYYSVCRGNTIGIFTVWSKCELSIYRFRHSSFKGFKSIDAAVNFLIAGSAFSSCNQIPVHDESSDVKKPVDFGHTCTSTGCNIDSIDMSILSENEIETPEIVHETDPKTTIDPKETIIEHETNLKTVNDIQKAASIGSNEATVIDINKNKPTVNTERTCTSCDKPSDKFMILCSKCELWTHYMCTRLPSYQLYMLVNSSRKYTCEGCTNMPQQFHDQWEPTLLHKNTEKEQSSTSKDPGLINSNTLDIVARIEESVVSAITEAHNLNTKEHVSELKSQLEREKQLRENQLTKIMGNLDNIQKSHDKLTDKISKIDTPTKDKGELNKLEKKVASLDKENAVLKSQIDNNKQLENVIQKLSKLDDNQNGLKQVLATLGDKTAEMTATLKSTCEAMLECTNKGKVQPTEKLKKSVPNIEVSNQSDSRSESDSHENETHQLYTCNVTTSNRYDPLSNLDMRDLSETFANHHVPHYPRNESSQTDGSPNLKSVTIIGNSHVKNIRTNYLIQNSSVSKIKAFSFEEAKSKLSEDVSDCIFIHTFINDLRQQEPEVVANMCIDLLEKIRDSSPSTKIVISLPFPTPRDRSLNEKIQSYNIHIQYRLMKLRNVTICENSGLSSRGTPIKKFFSPDGVHLSNEGLKVFASNIKHSINSSLGITNKDSDFKSKSEIHVRQRYNKRNDSKGNGKQGTFQQNHSNKMFGDRSGNNLGFHPGFLPFLQSFNPNMFGQHFPYGTS